MCILIILSIVPFGVRAYILSNPSLVSFDIVTAKLVTYAIIFVSLSTWIGLVTGFKRFYLTSVAIIFTAALILISTENYRFDILFKVVGLSFVFTGAFAFINELRNVSKTTEK